MDRAAFATDEGVWELLNGEKWHRNYGRKWAMSLCTMKDKAVKTVLMELQKCISRIRMMASEANRQVVRIHADFDKS